MVTIRTAFALVMVTLLVFGMFLGFVMNRDSISLTQYLGSSSNTELQSVREKLADALRFQQEVVVTRNNISRLLNLKQQELAKLQCEKVERENKTIEQTSATGGWCIHDAKETNEGGFHKTDLKLAKALVSLFKDKRVGSFGDGPGKYKKILDKIGQLTVYDAYDGAPYSEQVSEGRVKFLDLTLPQYGLPVYDYIISLEVAEHIPKQYETIYMDNLFRHAKEGIVLSWAHPGQPGHSHVNGKTFENVKILMENHSFCHDVSASNLLKQSSSLGWLKENINVFIRKKQTTGEVFRQNS